MVVATNHPSRQPGQVYSTNDTEVQLQRVVVITASITSTCDVFYLTISLWARAVVLTIRVAYLLVVQAAASCGICHWRPTPWKRMSA